MTLRTIHITMLALLMGCAQSAADGQLEIVTIPRGAVLAAVAETLYTRELVPSPQLFMFYATLSGRERAIQAGTYEIPHDASIRELLDLLIVGRPATVRLAIPEGLMLVEVAETVEQHLGISRDGLLEASRDSALRAALEVNSPTLEGYLYPSTYFIPEDATASNVIRQMVAEFEQQWRPEWTPRLDTIGMTRHQTVILASIIEGEVRFDPDRRFVSSVYHNRLRRGMPLQADPTVIYALGERRRLFERDYQIRSPYNTYLIDSLPPGPIGQPSAASIHAALYPARTDFLFFVARPDGKHVFSRTLREHRRAVREVRLLEADLETR